jgi:hypothetical protein
MDAMDPGPEKTKQFEDEAVTILNAWEADRANMSNFLEDSLRFWAIGNWGKGA